MESYKSCQLLRLSCDGVIANGDYIREGMIVRIKKGYLNDVVDEDKNLLPAIETHDGKHIEHWKNGELHKEGSPAVIDLQENYEEWWLNGKRIFPENREEGGIES